MEFVGTVFELLTNQLIEFLMTVVEKLPDSPFAFLDSIEVPATLIMGYINWFVDFGAIVTITLYWIGSVLGWRTYKIIFKWAHLVT